MSKVEEYLQIFSDAIHTEDNSEEETAAFKKLEQLHESMDPKEKAELHSILRARVENYAAAENLKYQRKPN